MQQRIVDLLDGIPNEEVTSECGIETSLKEEFIRIAEDFWRAKHTNKCVQG